MGTIYLLICKPFDHVVLTEVSMQILAKFQVRKKASGKKLSPLQQLQSMFSHKESAPRRML
jgi:cell division control protein 6